jgi:hypothetical protein
MEYKGSYPQHEFRFTAMSYSGNYAGEHETDYDNSEKDGGDVSIH